MINLFINSKLERDIFTVSQPSIYYTKDNLVNIVLKTSCKDIKNVRITFDGKEYFYMEKEKNTFSIVPKRSMLTECYNGYISFIAEYQTLEKQAVFMSESQSNDIRIPLVNSNTINENYDTLKQISNMITKIQKNIIEREEFKNAKN